VLPLDCRYVTNNWVILSDRESKASKSRADSQSNPLRDGEIGRGRPTLKNHRGSPSLFYAWHSSRHIIIYGSGVGRFVLSEGHAVHGLPHILRHAVCYGRSGLDLLRMSVIQAKSREAALNGCEMARSHLINGLAVSELPSSKNVERKSNTSSHISMPPNPKHSTIGIERQVHKYRSLA
jgi:hypothetical protein